jgi:SnoaL-like domain
MTHDDVQRWLDRYVDAWRTNEPAAVADLFGPDATYRFHPYDDDPVTGRDAIVANWLARRDEPGTWTAWYKPHVVEGDRAVAVGESRYLQPDGSLRDLYYNVWLLSFDDDGRCIDFVESYMELPERLRASH